MGRGQREAMSAEVTRRFTSCSKGVRKALQAAHVGSVGDRIGIEYSSIVGLTMREALRPAKV